MSDDEHPELDWDPLDDTKVWPENDFPPKLVGRMVLNRNVDNFFNDNEQLALGTGVLVDRRSAGRTSARTVPRRRRSDDGPLRAERTRGAGREVTPEPGAAY